MEIEIEIDIEIEISIVGELEATTFTSDWRSLNGKEF